jgi:hypothetical protein
MVRTWRPEAISMLALKWRRVCGVTSVTPME